MDIAGDPNFLSLFMIKLKKNKNQLILFLKLTKQTKRKNVDVIKLIIFQMVLELQAGSKV